MMSAELCKKMLGARAEVLTSHGSDQTYARRLIPMLTSRGLEDVRAESHMASWLGGSAYAKLEKANCLQSREEMLATGIITESEFDEILVLLDDPEWIRISPLMISAWGRKA